MIRFLASLLTLTFATPGWASAVAGCRYTGEVAELTRSGRTTSVALVVSTAEAFGHSGPPAVCADPGATVTLSVPTRDVRRLGVGDGAFVSASVTDVWNPPSRIHIEEITAIVQHPEVPAPAPDID